jgi:hypothetical protein
MVGLFEGLIDYLCITDNKKTKIVGSTATIRRAAEQCKALYNRETFQFPPSGIDASDSYFAYEDKEAPGRIYAGIFPTAASSFVTAHKYTAAAILQGVKTIDLPDGTDDNVRDPYWTLIQYFNSLRELGRALTLVSADIKEHIRTIVNRNRIPKEKVRYINNFDELTSRKTAQEIPEILETLSLNYNSAEEKKYSDQPLDTVLATNMISVGVDVDRLGLMLVIGQPKDTSEYIQATSRVGRSDDAPGLVVTMYNPGKSRDRSHFEQFRNYHASLYRYVEPTSVSPYSIPVIQRALHSLLIIIVRFFGSSSEVNSINFNEDKIKDAIIFLQERCKSIDPEHDHIFKQKIDELIEYWQNNRFDIWGHFGDPKPDEVPLMHPAGRPNLPQWNNKPQATPSSLRTVDTECEAEVVYVFPK